MKRTLKAVIILAASILLVNTQIASAAPVVTANENAAILAQSHRADSADHAGISLPPVPTPPATRLTIAIRHSARDPTNRVLPDVSRRSLRTQPVSRWLYPRRRSLRTQLENRWSHPISSPHLMGRRSFEGHTK